MCRKVKQSVGTHMAVSPPESVLQWRRSRDVRCLQMSGSAVCHKPAGATSFSTKGPAAGASCVTLIKGPPAVTSCVGLAQVSRQAHSSDIRPGCPKYCAKQNAVLAALPARVGHAGHRSVGIVQQPAQRQLPQLPALAQKGADRAICNRSEGRKRQDLIDKTIGKTTNRQ